MREELEREVVSRLSVSEKLVESLLAGNNGAASSAEEPSPQLAAGERTERAFLELCIALPARGRELLAQLDPDGLFNSPLARAAATHLRTHLESPTSGVDDSALATLLAELVVRAAALTPVPAELEVERCQLELARIDRAIAGARGAGAGGLTALVREREAVKDELESWLNRALAADARRARLNAHGCCGAPSRTDAPATWAGSREGALVWSNCHAEVEAGVADLPGWPIPG